MSSSSLATVLYRVFAFAKYEQNCGIWKRAFLTSAHSPHSRMHSFPFFFRHSELCFLTVFFFIIIFLLIVFFVCFFIFFFLSFLLFFWNLDLVERRIGVDTELFRHQPVNSVDKRRWICNFE